MNMPIYTYKCEHCGNEYDEYRNMGDRKEPTRNPCKQCGASNTIAIQLNACAIGDPHKMGRIKPPDGFNERLRDIASHHPKHKMNIRD